jgi:trimethylamine:corrinoid methyltransferase-like protein
VAVILGATHQFSITQARTQLAMGGTTAFRAWSGTVTRRLHMAFAGLTLAWLAAAIVAHELGPALPGHHLRSGMQDTVVVLAGCFLAGGWLSALCFADTMLLYLMRRNGPILLVSIFQLGAAAAVSLALYPQLGWVAIGVAEILRGLTFVAATRYVVRRLDR